MPRSIAQYTDSIKINQEGQSYAYQEEDVNSRPMACQSQHKNVTKELAKQNNQANTIQLPAKNELSYINTQIEPSLKDIENLTSQVSDMDAEKVHRVTLNH